MSFVYDIPAWMQLGIAALSQHQVEDGFLSVTQAISPPRVVQLISRHPELERANLPSPAQLIGTAMHVYMLETMPLLSIEIPGAGEYRGICGTPDILEGDTLYELKTMSAESWDDISKRVKQWERQLNIYAWMLQTLEQPVRQLAITVFITNWKAARARHGTSYPQQPIVTVPAEMYNRSATEFMIRDLLQKHSEASLMPDENLPWCTDEETWYTGPQWAVYRGGNKRATAVFDFYDDMLEWTSNKGVENILYHTNVVEDESGYYVVVRPGRHLRCETCPVVSVCNQRIGRNEIL